MVTQAGDMLFGEFVNVNIKKGKKLLKDVQKGITKNHGAKLKKTIFNN